jgi:hypothetical protein
MVIPKYVWLFETIMDRVKLLLDLPGHEVCKISLVNDLEELVKMLNGIESENGIKLQSLRQDLLDVLRDIEEAQSYSGSAMSRLGELF